MWFLKAYIRAIDSFTERSGRAVSWLTLLLVLVVVYDVFTRYVLSSSSVAVQELEWHLFALLFLLAAPYTLKHNKHVRVDVFYARLTEKHKALVNIVGGICFLVPFTLMVVFASLSFVGSAFVILESSPDPGGLPYRYLLKAAIPVGFLFFFLQGSAEIVRSILVLADNPDTTEKE
ncbi:MAG: TRAP transporter small permease subunit [Chlorobium phaeobacteroides]|uniref:Tripartite ATP-independent periplasmic transporter DctQ component n=1 Tax=Chlorobium phaeobacteroides (strain BS1) TaxID=331678 RepID=B3ELR2_CHLPB|nr:TRAP transporter small permease subunit [Chlorobium phaeobacteroides]